jgi:hypothetical protein
MIISDGTTDLTYTTSFTEPNFGLDQTKKMSTGAQIKSQIRGKRFITRERIRLTGTELRTLLDLLTNESNFYYYTPTNTPDYMNVSEFPMKVSIEEIKRNRKVWGGQEIYYIELEIKGTRFIGE